MVLEVKNLPANSGDVGDLGSIPGLGRYPGVGNSNPLQYSYLENPMDRGAWQATVHGVAKPGTTERLILLFKGQKRRQSLTLLKKFTYF